MNLVERLGRRLRERKIPEDLRKADKMLEERLGKIGNFERIYEPPSRNNNHNACITYSEGRLQVYLRNPSHDNNSPIAKNETYNFCFDVANSCRGKEEEDMYHFILSALKESYQLSHCGVILKQKPFFDCDKPISKETLTGAVNLLADVARDFYLLARDEEVLAIAKECGKKAQEAYRKLIELKEEERSLNVALESQTAEALKRIKQIRSIKRLQTI